MLPDAVHTAGAHELGDGEHIDELLVVNKERLFMENVGAVQELCRMTVCIVLLYLSLTCYQENLENRIRELEALNAAVARESLSRRNSGSSLRRASSTASAKRRNYVPVAVRFKAVLHLI